MAKRVVASSSAAGAATRARLVTATRHLLATSDGADVTLRAITTAAEANVAAVSYHFGSKDALCLAVVDQALRDVVDAQLARYAALPADATLNDVAVAFVEPILAGLTAQDADGRALLRIAARAASRDARSSEAAELARGTAELLRRLEALLPGVGELELQVRVEAVGAVMRSYAIGPLATSLAGLSSEEAERLLLPVVAGAWTGGRPG